jgi:hypothetical protein
MDPPRHHLRQGQSAHRLRTGTRIEGWPDPQTADGLAANTVVTATEYFRDKVLKTHCWQSAYRLD